MKLWKCPYYLSRSCILKCRLLKTILNMFRIRCYKKLSACIFILQITRQNYRHFIWLRIFKVRNRYKHLSANLFIGVYSWKTQLLLPEHPIIWMCVLGIFKGEWVFALCLSCIWMVVILWTLLIFNNPRYIFAYPNYRQPSVIWRWRLYTMKCPLVV